MTLNPRGRSGTRTVLQVLNKPRVYLLQHDGNFVDLIFDMCRLGAYVYVSFFSGIRRTRQLLIVNSLADNPHNKIEAVCMDGELTSQRR